MNADLFNPSILKTNENKITNNNIHLCIGLVSKNESEQKDNHTIKIIGVETFDFCLGKFFLEDLADRMRNYLDVKFSINLMNFTSSFHSITKEEFDNYSNQINCEVYGNSLRKRLKRSSLEKDFSETSHECYMFLKITERKARAKSSTGKFDDEKETIVSEDFSYMHKFPSNQNLQDLKRDPSNRPLNVVRLGLRQLTISLDYSLHPLAEILWSGMLSSNMTENWQEPPPIVTNFNSMIMQSPYSIKETQYHNLPIYAPLLHVMSSLNSYFLNRFIENQYLPSDETVSNLIENFDDILEELSSNYVGLEQSDINSPEEQDDSIFENE
eukprot:TRINITY_DN1920_c0_g1_i1.p1 TRINITY_DN1920_c0_g1~~TRINITY_DN1920_c0_g1_i1.p1  ORF type:complete len:327 (+),score=90.88 TRINITY_DN1920_c0_g1_i1:62-1042(+)